MNTVEPVLPLIHLKPGELLLTREPALIVTVLGSCITVTLFSVRPCCAGICHAMLSTAPFREPGREIPGRFKYLSEAIPFMAAHFRNLGIPPPAIEVKMFGGGNVTPHQPCDEHSERLIGNANIHTARHLIEAESLILKATNVGGQCGRKLLFNTRTGEVRHKYLPRMNPLAPL
jgi:chemotaxis protein CheD